MPLAKRWSGINENAIFVSARSETDKQCKIYLKSGLFFTCKRYKQWKGLKDSCANTCSKLSVHLHFKRSLVDVQDLITLPWKLKSLLALKTHPKRLLKQNCKWCWLLETAVLSKEWTKSSDKKEKQTITIHLLSEQSWPAASNFPALFSRACTPASVATVPC